MIDRDERGPDREHVREMLGEPGERSTRHSEERIDPSRDQEARDRLPEQERKGDRGDGDEGEASREDEPSEG